jgi:INO80 complex subunit B
MIDVEADNMEYSDNYSPSTSTQMSAADKLKSQGGKSKEKKKKTKIVKDDRESSEEERWLDAIESGKLEEVDDELKKIKPKDPKLMTARQRAMYERNADKEQNNSQTFIQATSTSAPGPSGNSFIDGLTANFSGSGELLLSLPTGYKEKEKIPLTEEAIQKAQLKSQKRKQLADEQREKNKKKTMERLLKKQDSKAVKLVKNKPVKQQRPVISYKNTGSATLLSYPPGFDFPLERKCPIEPPKPKLCGIPGCPNIKRYNCSKTNIPLCSFECYKKNVASVKQIIC